MPEATSHDLIKSIIVSTACTLREDSSWCASRIRSAKPPALVAVPSEHKQIAALLQQCSQHELAVSPVGGGTKRKCGGVARSLDFAISTEALNRVIEYPASDLTITVEAGITIKALRDTLARQGQMLPLDVPYAEQATLGGTLAANLNGPHRLGYGAWRDIVIGLEFATSDGKLARGGGKVVKNVAGYDLPKLLIGSFGTLGMITEVSMKVFPIPPRSASFVFGYKTVEQAGAAAQAVRNSQFFPQALQVVDAAAADVSRTTDLLSAPYNMAISIAGPLVVIERAHRDLPSLLKNSGASFSHRVDETMEAPLWRSIAEITPSWLEQTKTGIVVKATLPLTQLAPVAGQALELSSGAGIGCAINMQAGMGISYLHLWSRKGEEDGAKLRRVAEQTIALCEQLGGRAVMEWFPLEYDGKMNSWGTLWSDFSLMQQIKKSLDPQAILNPGRFYGGI